MNNYEELNLNELEQVSGGKIASIDTGNDQRAGIWTKWENIATRKADDTLENGTKVNTISALKYNETKERNYVQIAYTHKGKMKKGWVAASIVGLKR